MTFDGVQRLIILTEETISAKEIYSYWKLWVMDENNARFLPALSAIGGDPISDVLSLGTTFFLENGWKIRPKSSNHLLTLNGNLYTRDGTSPLVPAIGSYNVLVSMARSNLIDTVSTGGGSGGLTASQNNALMGIPPSLQAINRGVQKASLLIPHSEEV